jgi:hypothetical protein
MEESGEVAMLGVDRLWNAVQPVHMRQSLAAVFAQASEALHDLPDYQGVPSAVVVGGAFAIKDQLQLHTSRAPKGPFPSLANLQTKFPQAGLPSRMIGTTIDNDALDQPGATPDSVMARAKELGFNTVRLGSYWDLIQPTADGRPDFKQLDALLAAAQKRGLKVVLTVGAKAPNWPEFHVPTWVKVKNNQDPMSSQTFCDLTQTFVGLVAKRYANDPTIAMWQVENEPFDPSGPKKGVLRPDQVAKEAAILRQADGGRRPVMVNVWSDGDRRPQLAKAFASADIVGIDVYKNSGTSQGAFERTVGLPLEALRLSKQTGKPAMIAELQADDWGQYKSNGQDTTALANQLQGMGFRDMLFWRLSQNLKDDRAGRHSLADAETAFARQALGK